MFSVLCLITSHHWLLPSTTSLFCGWRWYLLWWFGSFPGVIQFSRISPMYRAGIHVIKLLFVFLLLICFLLQGCLNQELRNIEEKLFPILQLQLSVALYRISVIVLEFNSNLVYSVHIILSLSRILNYIHKLIIVII